MDARFAWFFQLMGAIESRMEAIFPISWQMPRRLSIFFCERTRAHLLTHLGAVASDELDVTSLLKALQKSLLFEREIVQRFEVIFSSTKENRLSRVSVVSLTLSCAPPVLSRLLILAVLR
jgi:hypothetical protein